MQAKELRDLSVDELQVKERDLREEICRLGLKRGTSQLESPMRPQQARRDLARVLTVLREANLNAAKGKEEGRP